ncbi:uncharacterized protein LOC144649065 [Oculina patagonica]
MSDRKWRPLNVGDAVYTRGGHLPCQFVIHTVGPRWNAHERSRCISLLNRACIESLRLAAKLELSSIALPAISSGIVGMPGMPKNICAQVMFDAVEELSSSTDAESSTLRDVRIVIGDEKTIGVFREEFVRRCLFPNLLPATNVTHQGLPQEENIENCQSGNLGNGTAAREPTTLKTKSLTETKKKVAASSISSNLPTSKQASVKQATHTSKKQEEITPPAPESQYLATDVVNITAPAGSGITDEMTTAKNVSKQTTEGNDVILNKWYEVESDVAQMRQTLNEEKLARNIRKQELKPKETALINAIKNALYEEQQARIDLRNTRERELREKETVQDQLQKTLREEQQAGIRVIEQLRQARRACNELKAKLRTEKESRQDLQQELRTKENAVGEQRRLLEEERQQKTTLEARLRNLEHQMQEERNRHLSTERELQSVASAAQEELTEYQRRQTRDWIIQREEVLLSDTVLGKGAWGNVRAGTFRSCQVAVKEIYEIILSPHNRRRFEREMSIASCCRHPNLLQFIGATNDDDSPLFVTELLDTSLRHLLSQRELNQEEIVSLALDVAIGLNYLHLNKPLPIIHRDISSANVLLWRRDERWRAKLSDYGSANFLRQVMTANPGARIYSAPEAFTSQQSSKVDVYSFGVLLCEMCIRELPVPEEIHNQIGQVTNGALRGLIQRCVQRDPETRPAMSEVICELEELAKCKRV